MQELFSFSSVAGKTFSLAFWNEHVLAAGGSDNVIRLWDLQSRRMLRARRAYRHGEHAGSS